ncbi:hydantoinase/oxoprolinase family protein [Tsukamurella sp. NPDC003166]|uniref:hydantoinase/oxoprolinase family protein n=1 Tax=Tsukamurella sp. NPDC003166 TaxID=3154444 RepID=UPI0033A5B0B2
MGRLINIDNGGTLTDICVIDGDAIRRTKTLTTPHDLSRCFVEGLREASKLVYGEVDLQSLLATTDSIRYSTTQGTNAIVEKKGPRIGVVLSGEVTAEDLAEGPARDFWDVLVGERVVRIDLAGDLQAEVVAAINHLTSRGASRVVVIHGGEDRAAVESGIRAVASVKFPKHLLGAVPVLYSHEVADDSNDARRAWTAVFNAFLHPAMEKFLYNAEHHLRANKNQRPLRIFRNDGLSARVAKTTAIKTYSSGPRGGIEGIKAVAAHYGFDHVVSMDVGGTTTDLAELKNGAARTDHYGLIHGIATSFPLSEGESLGVGGSSVIRAVDGAIAVGPESVGSAPGPACFGLGGDRATITDAAVASGLIDPATFFSGNLALDRDRAVAAIMEHVGTPLGLTLEQAIAAMQEAWVAKIADGLNDFAHLSESTTLAAFGGGGPLLACQVADAVGLNEVFIPGLAPVFSAFGLGFSDIGHRYETLVDDAAAVPAALAEILEAAKRDMFAEGADLADCTVSVTLRIENDGAVTEHDLGDGSGTADYPAAPGDEATLAVSVVSVAPHPVLSGRLGVEIPAGTPRAVAAGTRKVLRDGQEIDAPLYRVEDQVGAVYAAGPAVLEDEFFTCRIDPLWQFQINENGDILLSRQ